MGSNPIPSTVFTGIDRVFKLKIENSLVNAHTITSTTAVTINNENQNQIVEAEKFNLLQLMRKWSNNQLFLNYD